MSLLRCGDNRDMMFLKDLKRENKIFIEYIKNNYNLKNNNNSFKNNNN